MSITPTVFELKSSDGDPIRGDVWTGAGAEPGAAIVICHGFKGFKDWGFFPYLAAQLAERTRFPAVSFNFSGSGIGTDLQNFTELDKFEANTFSKEIEELRLVLDAAGAGSLPGLGGRTRFGLIGHSRGGIVSIITAADDARVAALVTWASVASVQRWTDEQKETWRRYGKLEVLNARTGQMMPMGLGLLEDVERNADRLDVLAAAARMSAPYLIIHGGDDESVNVAEGAAIASGTPAATARFETIAGAGHTFGAVHPFRGTTEQLERAIDLTADWFAEHLGNPVGP